MKKLFIILFLPLFTQLAIAQGNEPFLVKNFKGETVNKVNVTTSGGYIKVKGGASATSVKVFVKPDGLSSNVSKSEIENRLKNYQLEVSVSNGTLVCIAKPKSSVSNSNRLSISFEIESPQKVDTDLMTSGGSLSLDGLSGIQKLKTSGGSISLSGINGETYGATSGGSIKMNNCQNKADVKTSGGSITAENSKGELAFATSGGSLTFKNLEGKITGKTSGGSIKSEKISGEIELVTAGGSISFSDVKGDLDARTSGGSIKGNILSINKNISLKTSAGSVRVDLPFSEPMDLDIKGSRIYSDKLAKVTDNLKSGKVKGKVNGGGKSVQIYTSVGAVYVD